MDQQRQIRFLIPPFLLFSSLLWGLQLSSPERAAAFLSSSSATAVLGLLAAGAAALVPTGYVIGTMAISILRATFCLLGRSSYEAVLPEGALKRIWPKLKSSREVRKSDTLYAVATFDHEIIPPPIHEWIVRRWNSFNVSVHSCVALLLAHAVAPFLAVAQTGAWWGTTAFFIMLFGLNAVSAWKDTMRMIEFQSFRDLSRGAAQQLAAADPASGRKSGATPARRNARK
jgi:uncharacterized membrane protein